MARPHDRDTRHISLARALNARLYVNGEGRVFSVGGQAAPEKLALAFGLCDKCPTVAEAPTPADLGIPICDGELTGAVLHSISRALNRWRKELAAKLWQRRRPAQLLQEQQEVARLMERLATVRNWRADLADGEEPPGAPFFLGAEAAAGLQAALRDAQTADSLPPLIVWQARVVFWLAGDCATRRFLKAAQGLLTAYPEASGRRRVRGFQRAVIAWRQRSKWERIGNLLAEIAQHVRRLPPGIVRAGQFSARLRGRNFPEHCDCLLEGCSRLLASERLNCWRVAAALAALAATDGSTVELPGRCFRAGADQDDFAPLMRTIRDLAEQVGQPGYDTLLTAFDQLPESRPDFDLGQLRQWLAQGSSLADAVWACEQELLGRCLPSSFLSPAAKRDFCKPRLPAGDR